MSIAIEAAAPAKRPRRFAQLRVMSYLLPAAVLAAAIGISYYFWEKERRDIEQVMQADFDTRVREAVGIFRERMLAVEQVLYAINGLFASSGQVERGEFQAFVANLRIESHPGLQGVGYSVLIPAAEKEKHEAAQRSKGFPKYAIRPGGEREIYTSAIFFEPSAAAYLSTLGSDYLAEPSRRHAMEAARDNRGIAISNKIKLPEEDAKEIQAGFRMVLPVYRNGAPDKSLAERRANTVGWIFASFSMDGLLENILGERANIALEVYDGGDAVDESQLIDSSSDRVGGESAVKLFFASRRVEVGGYAWTITARSLPNFTTPIAISKLQLIASVGGVASIALALLTWFLMRRRIRGLKAADELRIAKEHAEAANRAKSQFLAAASHDLRQPTHALSLFIAALRSMAKRPQVKGEDVGAVAARLQLALDGLGRLLNGLLDVSRLEAGVVEINRAPILLQDRLNELHNAFSGPAQAKGLELKIMPTSLWADSDPVVLARVLSNLVANAVRYTERGRILIGCRRRANAIEIQVLDTGIGIAEDQRAKIFEEFYQVGNVARDREHGLGLGLAIVQRSVSLLGGSIGVKSIPGRGSCFSVTVPRAAPVIQPRNASAVSPATRRTILVIDDNHEVLESMQQLLAEWGHHAIAVRTLEAAVAAAKKHSDVGLILADYRLAETITGADAIRAVIACVGRAVPAVIITGDTSPERIREAQASGFTLLHKPLDTRQLQELLGRTDEST
jgi:signal transduction histidine kinase/ActR/RegA family two-component response regulator